MKQIKPEDKKAAINANFAALAPVWITTGVVAAFLWVIMTGTLNLFAMLAFGAGLILPNRLVTARRLKTINDNYKRMSDCVLGELTRCDYINIGEYGAIGVDAATKTLAIVSCDKKFKLGTPYKFTFDKVRNCSAQAPGHTEITLIGNKSITAQSQALSRNLQNQAEAHFNSGLSIDLDDINKPRVFVQMEGSEAEKWLLIFEKLQNNTLEKQSAPMLFPPQD